MLKIKGLIWLICLLAFSLTAHSRPPIGMNTNEIQHVDSSAPFVNLFKMAMPFREAKKLTSGNVVYDKDGWPRDLRGGKAGTYLIHWLPQGTLPEGQYTVLYDGEGQLEYQSKGGDVKLLHSAPGKDIIDIRSGPDRFIQVALIIKRSEPRNYLRNIRVLLPGGICANNPFKRVNSKAECVGSFYKSFEKHYDQILFNPDYLNFMKDFKVIRMMNMSGITRNPIRHWNQMNQMSKASWAGLEGVRGAPLEVLVRLANVLNRDAWFNIPHAADDNFVQQYARYLRQHLRPNLKAYIEYTNETWNTVFMQTHYTKQMGVKLGLDRDPNQAGYKYYSQRAVEIFNIFQQNLGLNRIVRVMGVWSANRYMTPVVMEHKNAFKSVDAMAIAPYFFVHQKALAQVNSVPSVFKLLKDDKANPYSMNNVYKMIGQQMEYAKKYGVKLIAYEGGQHLTDPRARSTKSIPNQYLIGANRAWPMEKFYVEFLQNWDRITGGSLFVAFSAPRTCQYYGCWGIKEYLNQPENKAPKYRALKRFF